MDYEQTHAEFHTTCWNNVQVLKDGSDPEVRRRCLDALFRQYAPPVYAFLRSRHIGKKPEEAAEITQAFFANVALQRDLFENACQKRGKLRTLIKTAVRNYQIDLHRQARSAGKDGQVPLDVAWLESRIDGSDALPEAAFERVFKEGILNEALQATEDYFTKRSGLQKWRLFVAHAVVPARACAESPGYAALAQEMHFETPQQARAAVQEVRDRLRLIFEAKMAATGGDAE